MAFSSRMKQAWNAFFDTSRGRQEFETGPSLMGPSSSIRQDKPYLKFYNDKSIISSIYTRLAMDVSGLVVRHVKLDSEERYASDIDSALNFCMLFEPNLDQSPRAFRQDVMMTLFDKGCAAIVPVDTTANPLTGEEFDVLSMRVAEVTQWYPKHVKVSVYNESRGVREEITLAKRFVAIVENPLYSVMNAPNSTLQRLIRKLQLLDAADEITASGKLDLIIQLPYVIKSEARKAQAEQRRQDIEFQLKGSQYGIAYTDGTEKITQLNRPAENNLLKQVEYLTKMLYEQLGITEDVMNGTANEATMLNYQSRTVEPLLDAYVEAMQRAFLGVNKLATQERIKYFKDPFKFVPISTIADIADKFARNEILTSNEIRQFLGIKPSTDPKADKLVNSNMPQSPQEAPQESTSPPL